MTDSPSFHRSHSSRRSPLEYSRRLLANATPPARKPNRCCADGLTTPWLLKLPASSPRNEHRVLATSTVPPNPRSLSHRSAREIAAYFLAATLRRDADEAGLAFFAEALAGFLP